MPFKLQGSSSWVSAAAGVSQIAPQQLRPKSPDHTSCLALLMSHMLTLLWYALPANVL